MNNYVAELNEDQLAVVQNADGPCLVLAGAGSGKTRVVTYRVAFLLEQGVKSENILLVTFTNKAAIEMTERVKHLVGADTNLPWAGTFHSVANKILRRYAQAIGYKNNFTILDSDDSESLLKLCTKEFKADGQRFPSARVLQNIISYARNAQTSLEKALELKGEQWLRCVGQIQSIAALYEQKKREANAMDFDDLLINWLKLLATDSGKKISEQFEYILVDEYQDTNKIQAAIIAALARAHRNLLVVGDDAQSIYSFRAADVNNILDFTKHYPDAKIFKLEANYRSSQEILSLANDVIANNVRQYKKNLHTLIRGEAKPALHPLNDAAGEANFIAKKISELVRSGHSAKEIAVLFRAAHHSQALEMELMRAGIAYDYRGGLRFFERAHIKDALAYLRLINNLADTAAWLRVLLHEDGIGPMGAQKIIEYVQGVENIEGVKNTADILSEKARAGWNNFWLIFERLLDCHAQTRQNPGGLINALLDSPYIAYLESEYLDSDERLADLKQLAGFAKKYDQLDQFLSEASLQENYKQLASDQADSHNQKIILSTIHQAKGLEWSTVFMINLCAGGFPNNLALRKDNGLEEERRLFYVAITRAKRQLVLTYPLSGGWGDNIGGPSLFLSEINPVLLDDHSLLSSNLTILNDEQEDIRYISEDQPRFKPGELLRSVDDL